MRRKYKCKYCGQLYSLSQEWQGKVYCSQQCKYKDTHDVFVCDCCGVKFYANKSARKYPNHYCSPECYNVARTRKDSRKMFYCDFCGKPFIVWECQRQREHKFCSHKCCNAYKNLPKCQDGRLIEYCYQLVGQGVLDNILNCKTRYNNLYNECKGEVYATIQKYLSSEEFRKHLLRYICGCIDYYIMNHYKKKKKRYKKFKQFVGNRTYDELAEIANLK